MQTMTSAEANKLLKSLVKERDRLKETEKNSMMFLASVGEDPESNRPAYDFAGTQGKLRELEDRIVAIKHALSVFNTTMNLPYTDMTIDQALVRMPLLKEQVDKLSDMARMPKKKRVASYHQTFVDYEFANFDPDEVLAMLREKQDELTKLQLALDKVNMTEPIDIDM